jgi:dihydroorotate dehydrogenase electron transfer subunit
MARHGGKSSGGAEAQRTRQKLVSAQLLRRESIGEAYHVLTFEAPEALEALPGQFAMVRGLEWGNAPLLPRPMSFLGSGTTPSILIKVVGEGTARMARAEPGETFSLLGPLGRHWRSPTAGHRPLLVAGGVGIAPLLFLARRLVAQGVRPISIYGGRSDRDLPLDDELAELTDMHVSTEDGSRGTRGRATDLLAALLKGTQSPLDVFTCGPDPMMAKVAEICAEHGVPCEASLETPMACGYGVCLGCPVPTVDDDYLYACVHGPCVDARRIAWKSAPRSRTE